VQSVLIVNPQASKVTEPLIERVARTLDVAEVRRTERETHLAARIRQACRG